jgi:hypothetical protein
MQEFRMHQIRAILETGCPKAHLVWGYWVACQLQS